MREGVRVVDDPRQQRGRQLLVERHAELRQQQRDHLAGRSGRRIDAVRLSEAGVRDVVVDVRDPCRRQPVGVLAGDRPGARQVPRVDHHRHVRLQGRRLTHRVDARHERQVRGWRVAAHHLGLLAQPLGDDSDGDGRAKRVGVRVLMADGGHALCAAQQRDDLVHEGFPPSARSVSRSCRMRSTRSPDSIESSRRRLSSGTLRSRSRSPSWRRSQGVAARSASIVPPAPHRSRTR